MPVQTHSPECFSEETGYLDLEGEQIYYVLHSPPSPRAIAVLGGEPSQQGRIVEHALIPRLATQQHEMGMGVAVAQIDDGGPFERPGRDQSGGKGVD